MGSLKTEKGSFVRSFTMPGGSRDIEKGGRTRTDDDDQEKKGLRNLDFLGSLFSGEAGGANANTDGGDVGGGRNGEVDTVGKWGGGIFKLMNGMFFTFLYLITSLYYTYKAEDVNPTIYKYGVGLSALGLMLWFFSVLLLLMGNFRKMQCSIILKFLLLFVIGAAFISFHTFGGAPMAVQVVVFCLILGVFLGMSLWGFLSKYSNKTVWVDMTAALKKTDAESVSFTGLDKLRDWATNILLRNRISSTSIALDRIDFPFACWTFMLDFDIFLGAVNISNN